MSKAQQFLDNKSNQSGMNVNYQPALDNYKQQSSNIMSGYQSGMQSAYDKYSSSMNNNLGALKQQTQMQINALNQQLANNQKKYELMGQQQTNRINSDYKDQNDAIDQQAFNQYKYSNQMGAQRGVSQSAQQTAMDNHVGQATASLFNENSKNRSNSLSDLQMQIMSGMIDLDNQYSSDLTSIQTNALNQYMNHNTTMSGKELEFATSMADKIMQQQMETNQLEFATKKEEEEYKAKLAQSIYQMQFSNLQAVDNRDFQSAEAEKDRAFQAEQNALNRALQERLSASKSSSSSGTSEEDLMINEMMAYYTAQGYNPMQARDLAIQMVKRANASGSSNVKAPSVTQMSGYSTADRSNATSYQKSSKTSNSANPTTVNTINSLFGYDTTKDPFYMAIAKKAGK